MTVDSVQSQDEDDVVWRKNQRGLPKRLPNLWIGVSVTSDADNMRPCGTKIDALVERWKGPKFVSFEPLHGPAVEADVSDMDWIIIGAETGNRKGRIEPKEEWIADLVEIARKADVPIWMKANLSPYWRDELIQEGPIR